MQKLTVKRDHTERITRVAEKLGLPADVLLDVSLEALCDALERDNCLTFPLRVETLLPRDD